MGGSSSGGFGAARYGAPYNQVLNVVNYGESTAPASAPGEPMRGGGYNAGGFVTVADYGTVAGAQMAPSYAEPSTSGGSGAMYGSIYTPQTTAPSAQAAPSAYGYHGPPATAVDTYSGGYTAAPQPNYYYNMPGGAAAPAAEYGGQQQQYVEGYQMRGGTLLDAVTAVTAPPRGAQPGPQPTTDWQVHYAADGRPYYYNAVTKETTWNAPAAGT